MTAFLLRSPVNAQRLLEPLGWALKYEGRQLATDGLRRNMGLDEWRVSIRHTQGRRRRPGQVGRIIRETPQYGVLSALPALVYFGSILLLRTVFEAATGESPLLTVVSGGTSANLRAALITA